MTKKEISKASKLYAMFIDNTASENEKETARKRLFDLLKKNKASLKDFVADMSSDNAKLFDFSQVESQLIRNYKLTDNTLKASENEKSRRAIVISLLKENAYTKREIAQILTSQYDIADLKQNLKCVSGTMYDLQTHKKASFKIDNETDKIISVFV